MVEHLLCKQEVVGSIPIRSTPKNVRHDPVVREIRELFSPETVAEDRKVRVARSRIS